MYVYWKRRVPSASEVFPIVSQIKEYDPVDLVPDICAGMSVFFTMVPQGIAYAQLGGMPPIYGLYTAGFPLWIYAIFGTSRHLIFGPFAITSFMMGSIIAMYPEFELGTIEYIQFALYLTLCVGVIFFLMWATNLGNMVSYISGNVSSAFVTGCASLVILHQANNALGYKLPHTRYSYDTVYHLLAGLPQSNGIALAISIPSFIALYLCTRYKKARPPPKDEEEKNSLRYRVITQLLNLAYFIVFVFGLLVGYLVEESYDKAGKKSHLIIVGDIPRSLQAPQFNLSNIPTSVAIKAVPQALTLALVALMTNWNIARRFAERFKYKVNIHNELLSYSMINILGSLTMNSFVNAAGMARTAVGVESGAKTQLSNVIASSLVVMCIYTFGPLLYYLPGATLGAIVCAAVIGMVDIDKIVKTYEKDKKEAAVMTVTFLSVFWIGVTQGMIIGIFCSVASHLYFNFFPQLVPLGVAVDPMLPLSTSASKSSSGNLLGDLTYFQQLTEEYSNSISQGPVVKAIPKVCLYRIEASAIYFGNTSYIRETLVEKSSRVYSGFTKLGADSDGSHGSSPGSPASIAGATNVIMTLPSSAMKAMILDLTLVVQVDAVALNMFVELKKELLNKNMHLCLVNQLWNIQDFNTSTNTAGIMGTLATNQEEGEEATTQNSSEIEANKYLKKLISMGFLYEYNEAVRKSDGATTASNKPVLQPINLFQSLTEAVNYYSVLICVHTLQHEYEEEEEDDKSRPSRWTVASAKSYSMSKVMDGLARERQQKDNDDKADETSSPIHSASQSRSVPFAVDPENVRKL
jgi:SulP family sulfate permease